MSTLSKLFVVMILVLALVLLGVNATLFAMRADFKHKFVEEARHHYATQVVKSAELADAANRIDALTKSYDVLKGQNATLDTEITNLKGQIASLTTENGVKQTALDKQTAALETIGRALDTQLQQINDAMAKVEEKTKQYNQAKRDQLNATQDLQYQRQETERLSKDLGALEENYQELARDRQRLQETIAHLNAAGIRTDVIAPRKALSGKVTAVATELDLVVISIGRDAGVNEGDEFTVYRGNVFVGKIVIDRVDRPWASGRVVLKGKEEPRIGDDASNNILATPGKSGN
jgi:predicted  nucleic acid-binding Zn-ribbon protein